MSQSGRNTKMQLKRDEMISTAGDWVSNWWEKMMTKWPNRSSSQTTQPAGCSGQFCSHAFLSFLLFCAVYESKACAERVVVGQMRNLSFNQKYLIKTCCISRLRLKQTLLRYEKNSKIQGVLVIHFYFEFLLAFYLLCIWFARKR